MYMVNFPQQSNAADWMESIALISEDDKTPIDLTGSVVKIGVWTQTQRGMGSVAPATWSYGGQSSSPIISAASNDGTGNLVVTPADGVIQIAFRASTMSTLAAGFYEVGLTISKDADTVQLILGILPVVNGGVL